MDENLDNNIQMPPYNRPPTTNPNQHVVYYEIRQVDFHFGKERDILVALILRLIVSATAYLIRYAQLSDALFEGCTPHLGTPSIPLGPSGEAVSKETFKIMHACNVKLYTLVFFKTKQNCTFQSFHKTCYSLMCDFPMI